MFLDDHSSSYPSFEVFLSYDPIKLLPNIFSKLLEGLWISSCYLLYWRGVRFNSIHLEQNQFCLGAPFCLPWGVRCAFSPSSEKWKLIVLSRHPFSADNLLLPHSLDWPGDQNVQVRFIWFCLKKFLSLNTVGSPYSLMISFQELSAWWTAQHTPLTRLC